MRFYMRKLSLYIRSRTSNVSKTNTTDAVDAIEDDIVNNLDDNSRLLIVVVCRSRQRLVQQAWNIWVKGCNVYHNYANDTRLILSRYIHDNELRTELEVEAIFKWVIQNHHFDPTGIAHMLKSCKKRSTIVSTIQHCRLERYEAGDTIICQGDLPRPEDGHFTILSGECEIVQFPQDSRQMIKLHALSKKKNKEGVKQLLQKAKVLHTLRKPSGFGELSSSVKVKRSSSIRASTAAAANSVVDIIVIPIKAMIECIDAKNYIKDDDDRTTHSSFTEALDYLRLSGLAHGASQKDVLRTAECMEKKLLTRGDIMFIKGQPVTNVFILISGEILVDIGGDEEFNKVPFLHAEIDKCFALTNGSILGDEGLVGWNKRFESSAVVISEVAIVFVFEGFGLQFLSKRLGIERYAALAYRDRPKRAGPLKTLTDEVVLHSLFDSVRRVASYTHPNRGIVKTVQRREETSPVAVTKVIKHTRRGTFTDISRRRPAHPTSSTELQGTGSHDGGGSSIVQGTPWTLTESDRNRRLHSPAPHKHTSSKKEGGGTTGGGNTGGTRYLGGLSDVGRDVRKEDAGAAVTATATVALPKRMTVAAEHHVENICRLIKKRMMQQMKADAKEEVFGEDNMNSESLPQLPNADNEALESKLRYAIDNFRSRTLLEDLGENLKEKLDGRGAVSLVASFFSVLMVEISDKEKNQLQQHLLLQGQQQLSPNDTSGLRAISLLPLLKDNTDESIASNPLEEEAAREMLNTVSKAPSKIEQHLVLVLSQQMQELKASLHGAPGGAASNFLSPNIPKVFSASFARLNNIERFANNTVQLRQSPNFMVTQGVGRDKFRRSSTAHSRRLMLASLNEYAAVLCSTPLPAATLPPLTAVVEAVQLSQSQTAAGGGGGGATPTLVTTGGIGGKQMMLTSSTANLVNKYDNNNNTNNNNRSHNNNDKNHNNSSNNAISHKESFGKFPKEEYHNLKSSHSSNQMTPGSRDRHHVNYSGGLKPTTSSTPPVSSESKSPLRNSHKQLSGLFQGQSPGQSQGQEKEPKGASSPMTPSSPPFVPRTSFSTTNGKMDNKLSSPALTTLPSASASPNVFKVISQDMYSCASSDSTVTVIDDESQIDDLFNKANRRKTDEEPSKIHQKKLREKKTTEEILNSLMASESNKFDLHNSSSPSFGKGVLPMITKSPFASPLGSRNNLLTITEVNGEKDEGKKDVSIIPTEGERVDEEFPDTAIGQAIRKQSSSEAPSPVTPRGHIIPITILPISSETSSVYDKDGESEVLLRFQEMIKEDSHPSRYQEGRRRAVKASRFRSVSNVKFNSEDIDINTTKKPQSSSGGGAGGLPSVSRCTCTHLAKGAYELPVSGSRQDLADINTWIDYVAGKTVACRKIGQVSLPVLGKDSAHAALWGNKLVTVSGLSWDNTLNES